MDEARLLEKLRDLENLIAGATTPGEAAAAGNARDRIRARLHLLEQQAPPVEYRLTTQDMWSKRLLLALLRRYELKPYRYKGQRRTTVMVRVPRSFMDETLWPHYQRASAELRTHLDDLATKVIESALEEQSGDAEERDEVQPRLPAGSDRDAGCFAEAPTATTARTTCRRKLRGSRMMPRAARRGVGRGTGSRRWVARKKRACCVRRRDLSSRC
jgi:hypothetical protein